MFWFGFFSSVGLVLLHMWNDFEVYMFNWQVSSDIDIGYRPLDCAELFELPIGIQLKMFCVGFRLDSK